MTPVKAPVAFPTTDRVFPMVPPPIFSTRVSSVGLDIRSVSFMLNPSASDFVPWSTVVGPPGLAAPSTCVSQQHLSSSVQSLGISHSLGFDPQHFVPGGQQATTVSSNLDSAMDSTRVLVDLAAQFHVSRIPVPEPPVFSGDPLDYASWKSAFETLIEQKQIPPAERIYYLKRYLGGKARECLECYFLYSSESSFAEAKELLEKIFGDPYVIQSAFRDKLKGYPKIPSRDSAAL